MTAAVCWGVGEVVRVEEIQVLPPKEGEARIKMLRASLCHTDILLSQGFPVVSIFSSICFPFNFCLSFNISFILTFSFSVMNCINVPILSCFSASLSSSSRTWRCRVISSSLYTIRERSSRKTDFVLRKTRKIIRSLFFQIVRLIMILMLKHRI